MDLATITTTAGYRALRGSAAWIDLRARAKIRATGEDRARLLHAISTNHIEQLKPGEGCYAFFLSAQGRILCDANILCFEDSLLLDTEPETRLKLLEHLDRYTIADDVVFTDETEALATIAVEGPQAAAILQKAGATLPTDLFSWRPWQDRVIARLSSTGSTGYFLFVPASETMRLVNDLGIPQASAEDARVVRLENGHPRYSEEITERNLVQETGQLHAVHFNKGCYLGQEIVERVRTQAKIHRVLRRLEIETADPPPPGTKSDSAEVITAAFSPALQKTVAFAYVKTEASEPGTALTINGARALVSVPLPPPPPTEM